MLPSFFRRARPLSPTSPVEPDTDGVAEVVEAGEAPPSPEPVPSNPAAMRRERREFAYRREIELRDVGGLAVEMVRRDRFNPDLLTSRANEVLQLEHRIHELDSLLAAELSTRGLRHVPHCKCGAPLPPGVHFCSHCGRPAAGAPAVVSCSHCGQPLPAEANFCPFCGNPVAANEYGAGDPAPDFRDSTLLRPGPRENGSDEA